MDKLMDFLAGFIIYETPMVTTTHNRLVGIVHFVVSLGILAYIIFFVFLYNRGYLEYDVVQGKMMYTWENDRFDRDSPSFSTPYCHQKACSPVMPYDLTTLYRLGFIIPTRLMNATADGYMRAPEKLIFRPRAAIMAYSGQMAVTTDKFMHVDFEDSDGEVAFSSLSGSDAFLTYEMLLSMVGASMDTISDLVNNLTIRETGATILGVMHYSNLDRRFPYTAMPHRGRSRFFLVETHRNHSMFVFSDPRHGYNLTHFSMIGLELQFILTGLMGHLDFNYAYVQLITSLALFKLAILLTDLVLFGLFPSLKPTKFRRQVVLGFRAGFRSDVADDVFYVKRLCFRDKEDELKYRKRYMTSSAFRRFVPLNASGSSEVVTDDNNYCASCGMPPEVCPCLPRDHPNYSDEKSKGKKQAHDEDGSVCWETDSTATADSFKDEAGDTGPSYPITPTGSSCD